jgi:mycothiol synthase
LSDQQPYELLEMVWQQHLLSTPPSRPVPDGYRLRTYLRGDEAQFYPLMTLAGWPGWDDAKLAPWFARIVPDGWFFVVHEASDKIVAAAMGIHSHAPQHPFGGELGWVAGDPEHAGKGLGAVVVSAVTSRLIAGGYKNIHLYTEHWRFPALSIYFRLGYVPYLYNARQPERWRVICEQISRPFTPEQWRQADT